MGPVSRGWCKIESAYDGTLDLYHFGVMNDWIAIESENARRWRAWEELHRKKK